jgi:hypothetical protein
MKQQPQDPPETRSQVRSRERVVAHGEVFTAPREVNAMLDLVKTETERIDSRFLEPACGDGNFLIEILRRKLQVVAKKSRGNPSEYELLACQAVASVYGIELLPDNAEACRSRLLAFVRAQWQQHTAPAARSSEADDSDFLRSVAYLLRRNIICGDALTYQTVGPQPHPIFFSDWTFIGHRVKRTDYRYDFMVRKQHQYSLFDEAGEVKTFDEPVREYPTMHFLKLYTYGE